MSVKLDPTLNYETQELENSSYTAMKLVPLSGNQSQTVSSGAGQDVTFEIPVQCVNLARSYFSAKISIPEQKDSTDANGYVWKHEGIIPFESIQLFTRGGMYLCNLQERATDYSRVTISADSTDSELQHGDSSGPLFANKGGGNYLLAPAVTDATDPEGGRTLNTASRTYWEQQYSRIGAQRDGSDAGKVEYQLTIPFDSLKGTIFEVDKSILFREVLVLKLKLAKADDIAWVSGSATNPSTNRASIAGNITFSEIACYIQQERSASVVQALNIQTASQEGFSLMVPYPSVFTNTRSGSSQSVSVRLNKSHGSALKYIKNCVFNNNTNADSLDARYDRNNRNQNKVVKYYTNINNNRLQEYDVDSQTGLDWQHHKKALECGPTYTKSIYDDNWLAIEDFSNYADKNSDMKTKDSNILSGVSLAEEIRYDIYYTCPGSSNNFRHFTIIGGQKVMNINQNGLVLM